MYHHLCTWLLCHHLCKYVATAMSLLRYVSEFESVLHEGAGARNQEELTERLVSNLTFIFSYASSSTLYPRQRVSQSVAGQSFELA